MNACDLDRHAALCCADKDDGLESGRMVYQRGNRGKGGTALSKVRFLSVVGAKLRTEVVTVRRSPKFNITIAGTERLVAERAACGAAVLEIPAARDHQIPPPSEKQKHGVASF
jgi:hypothetical protein